MQAPVATVVPPVLGLAPVLGATVVPLAPGLVPVPGATAVLPLVPGPEPPAPLVRGAGLVPGWVRGLAPGCCAVVPLRLPWLPGPPALLALPSRFPPLFWAVRVLLRLRRRPLLRPVGGVVTSRGVPRVLAPFPGTRAARPVVRV